jgi:hypothetical protein
LTQRQIRQEQGVIHDQDVGASGAPSGLMKETGAKVRTLAATALIRFAADLVPEGAMRKKREILA